MNQRIWIDDPPDLWRYGNTYRVRIRVQGVGFAGSIDLSPRSLRRLGHNCYLAAEYAEEKGKK